MNTKKIQDQQAAEQEEAAKKQKGGQLTMQASIERMQGYSSKLIKSLLNGNLLVTITISETSLRQAATDIALVNMLMQDLQPASIVVDKGFNEFIKVIDPKYIPPTHQTIMQVKLPKLYESKYHELKEELKNAKFCLITTD